MDNKDFMKAYGDLAGISDSGAEILGSDACRDYVSQSGVDAADVLARMQLEQEKFFEAVGGAFDARSFDDVRSRVEQTILQNLRNRLSVYSPEECRGVLLNMLKAIHEMNGAPWGEAELTAWSRKATEELESCLAAQITRNAQRLLVTNADRIIPQEVAADGVENPAASQSACAAAIAAAAYVTSDGLRDMPESVADVSAASACLIFGPMPSSEPLEWISFVLLTVSSLVLLETTVCIAIGVVTTTIGATVAVGAPVTLAAIGGAFVSVMGAMQGILRSMIAMFTVGEIVRTIGLMMDELDALDAEPATMVELPAEAVVVTDADAADQEYQPYDLAESAGEDEDEAAEDLS